MAKIKEPEYGLNQDVRKTQDIGTKEISDMSLNKGITPTKRDKIGNILLYENPNIEGEQLDLPNQWISVELKRPTYDDDELISVLDYEINELYKKEKDDKESKLRKQIEELRKQLKEAKADINITQIIREGGPRELEEGVILPLNATTYLPDRTEGDLSETPLEFQVNTAIYDTDNQRLKNIGSANPITINYYIVKNQDGVDFAYGYGTDETLFTQEKLQDDTFIDLDESYDVDLQIEQNDLSNFYGWWFKDTSSGEISYVRITNETELRFHLSRRKNTGVNDIDDSLNTYELLAVFKTEAPKQKDKVTSGFNLNTGVVTVDYPTKFNIERLNAFLINYYDKFGRKINKERIVETNPFNTTINVAITLLIQLRFDTSKLPNNATFYGWFKESEIGFWEFVTDETTVYVGSDKLAPGDITPVEMEENMVLTAGYTIDDSENNRNNEEEPPPESDDDDDEGTLTIDYGGKILRP